MRQSLRLGRIQSVPIEIHWTFALLVLWVGWQEWQLSGSWKLPYVTFQDLLTDWGMARYILIALGEAAGEIGFALLLLVLAFACILVHEVGHMVHAQALGIPVRRILLLPLGGLAELARLPERAIDEFRVALAGPVANLGLGLIFSALAYVWLVAQRIPSQNFWYTEQADKPF